MSDAETKVWITTERRPDGKYVVTLAADEDHAMTVTRARATRYALGILDAAHRAAYDAAVMRQLVGAGTEYNDAGLIVNDLREARPPLDAKATRPMSFTPGVSAFTGEPFIHILIDGKMAGQWTVKDATGHALGMLEAVVVAELDTGYYRALRKKVGVDENVASAMVGELSEWRSRE